MSTNEQLPEGWIETKLEDILPIQYGKGLTGTLRDKNGEVPVYGSSGIVGYHNQALTSNETIIIGRKGSVGSVYYSPVPCWPIDTTYFAEKTPSINLIFFLYLLASLQLVKLDKSTAIPGLSRDDYDEITIKLPPGPEQARIVAAIEQQFSRLDSAVASLHSAQIRTKQLRASLLKSAVKGELTKSWREAHPASETGEQLLERILAERRARWEEDQLAKMQERGKVPWNDEWKKSYQEPERPDVEKLPELPEGWCWATVEQLSDERRAITYGVIKLGDPITGGIPILRSSNVRHLRFDLENLKSISPDIANQYRRTFLQGGEILVTVRGTLGGVAVVPSDFASYNISREVAMIAFVWPSIATCLAFFIGSPPMQNWMMQNTKGIAYTGINIETLKVLSIPLPPLTEQAQIVAEIEAQFSEIAKTEETIEHSLRRAEQDRQSILREAFAGRLVEQDPQDEPASELLLRIREEREKREAEEKERRKEERKMINARKPRTYKNNRERIYYTLASVETALKPEDVFIQGGFDVEKQPESVEAFQVALTPLEKGNAVREEPASYGIVTLRALELPVEELQALLTADADEEVIEDSDESNGPEQEQEEAEQGYKQLSFLDQEETEP